MRKLVAALILAILATTSACAGDWSKPTLTDTYTNFLSYLNTRLNDVAVQFNGVTATNIPTNTVRWNAGNKNWESWNGSTWAALATTYGINVNDAATTGGLKVIRGTVYANNTIAAGSGFSMGSKGATGYFTVNFTGAFASAPTVLLTAVDGGGVYSVANLNGYPGTSSFQIRTFIINQAGYGTTLSDQPFSFVAVGP